MAGNFLNDNLCGASSVVNNVLSKLQASKAAQKASIPATATATVAVVEGDKNALTSFMAFLQKGGDWIAETLGLEGSGAPPGFEYDTDLDEDYIFDQDGYADSAYYGGGTKISTTSENIDSSGTFGLPEDSPYISPVTDVFDEGTGIPLSLQAEVTVLNELTEGTQEYITAVEKIVNEFGDAVAAVGSEIFSVISQAKSLITKGFDPCSIVPNLQKNAGSTSAAQLKPSNIKVADADPIPEKKSGSSFTEALNKILLGDLSELSTEEAAKRGIEYGTPENIDSAGIFGTSADNTDNKFNFNSNANTAIINGKPVQKNPAGNWINPDGFTVNQKTGDIKKN
tara:strand:- start:60 stop:1079 length:1020 start_codon:yes stop_codon:yes gene_type:complete